MVNKDRYVVASGVNGSAYSTTAQAAPKLERVWAYTSLISVYMTDFFHVGMVCVKVVVAKQHVTTILHSLLNACLSAMETSLMGYNQEAI